MMTKKRLPPEDSDQCIINTPFGRGLVIKTRKDTDNIKEVEMLEWQDFASTNPASSSKQMLYTSIDYPSVTPHVGDDVVCQYGRGRITHISKVMANRGEEEEKKKNPILKYTIRLSSWKIGGRSDVTCHVTTPPPRVVRKHTASEMDAFEKVELAQTKKSKATQYFIEKEYNQALTIYATAVNAVRNVQHDHSSTNEVR